MEVEVFFLRTELELLRKKRVECALERYELVIVRSLW